MQNYTTIIGIIICVSATYHMMTAETVTKSATVQLPLS